MKTYIKSLFRHWVAWFSVLTLLATLLFGVVRVATGRDVTEATILGLVIALVGYFFAGYSAWKDVRQQLPKPADFELKYDGTRFGSTASRNDFPISPMHFKIALEAINRGPNDIYLDDVKVSKLRTSTALLADEPRKAEFAKKRGVHGKKHITLPLIIEGRSREPNLELKLVIPLTNSDLMEFAEKLCEFQDYQIELTYIYRDMTSNTYQKTLPIAESFEDFRDGIIQSLRDDKKKSEYLEAARKGGCV